MMHWRAEASSDVVRHINETGSGVNEAQEKKEAKGTRYQPKRVRRNKDMVTANETDNSTVNIMYIIRARGHRLVPKACNFFKHPYLNPQ